MFSHTSPPSRPELALLLIAVLSMAIDFMDFSAGKWMALAATSGYAMYRVVRRDILLHDKLEALAGPCCALVLFGLEWPAWLGIGLLALSSIRR